MASPSKKLMPSGIPTYGWGAVGLACALLSAILTTVFLVAMATHSNMAENEVLRTMMIFFACGTGGSTALYSMRESKELAASYTTNPLRNPGVDLCDWRTGVILRRANETMLSWPQYLKVRRLARANLGAR